MNRLYRIGEMLSLDPRTKLFLTIAFAVVLTLTTDLAALGIESAVVALMVMALGLRGAWLKTLRVLLPMTTFLVVVVFFSFDLATALAGALRLIAMTTVFFIFFHTTAPEDLANALVASGVPYAFAFILTASMQFVPVLSRKMQDVIDAQRARGIRLERDLASVRNYPALFIPLLVQSFTLAEQLAEAMEARGFGAPRRTSADNYSFRRVDYAVIFVTLVIILLAWQLR